MLEMKILNIKQSLAIVVAIEAMSMVLTRLALLQYPNAVVEVEIFRTALRLGTAAVYWWLLKPVILARPSNLSLLNRIHVWAGAALVLLVPVLVGRDNFSDKSVAAVFAITSIAVGIKEEVLYRGIIQNLLGTRMGMMKSIFITSALFTAWHLGVRPPLFSVFLQIFLFSLAFGLIYARSGSLLAVIFLHALLDALFPFSPYLSSPLHPIVATFMLIYAVLLLYHWASKPTASRSA